MFEVLSDSGNQVAQTYKVALTLPESLRWVYSETFKLDLPAFNGDDSWTLPMPSRFIVDQQAVIRAADVKEVRAELDIDCRKLSQSRCDSYQERLRLQAKRTDAGVAISLSGLSFWKLGKLGVEGVLTVPRWSPLVAHIGIGEVEIDGGGEDLQVHMGIGDLTVRLPQDKVGSVSILTKIVDASIHGVVDREGSRRKLLGAQAVWTAGTGDAQVLVGLKIGDATVFLEQ